MPYQLQLQEKAHHVLALIAGWTFILGGVAICCAWPLEISLLRELGITPPGPTEDLMNLCDLHLGYVVVLLGVYWRLKERYAWRGYRSWLLTCAGLFGALWLVIFLILAFGLPWIDNGEHPFSR